MNPTSTSNRLRKHSWARRNFIGLYVWGNRVHHAGCSKRPSSKAAASEEARRTLRYVEPLSEARTRMGKGASRRAGVGRVRTAVFQHPANREGDGYGA